MPQGEVMHDLPQSDALGDIGCGVVEVNQELELRSHRDLDEQLPVVFGVSEQR